VLYGYHFPITFLMVEFGCQPGCCPGVKFRLGFNYILGHSKGHCPLSFISCYHVRSKDLKLMALKCHELE